MTKFKVKANAIAHLRQVANVADVAPGAKHPWADPVNALFGSFKRFPDLLDFFSDVSHKKGLGQKPLKLQEVFDLIVSSYDEVEDKTNPKSWQRLMGVDNPVEGSAYTTSELNGISQDVKRHYAHVAVPTGFDWAARGINLRPLLEDTDLWEAVPAPCRAVWGMTILIVIWVVYEALGLGGLDQQALVWHGHVRQFCRSGELDPQAIGLGLPEKVREGWLDAFEDSVSDYQFLRWVWGQLLEGAEVPLDWAYNPWVFENVMFLAHGRELVARIQKGRKLGDYLEGYTYGDMDNQQILALTCGCQLLRDGAKGRLTLQEIVDKTEDVAGPLGYLLDVDPCDMLGHLEGKVKADPVGISVTSVCLLDQARLNESWVLGRQEAKLKEAEG